MDALTAIKSRHSVRKFDTKPLLQEQVETLVDAGRRAATARNEQPWEFVVVTKRETLEQLANLTDNGGFIARAAACIVVFCKDTKYYLEDGCAATENILLAAVSLGLGACWVAGEKKGYAQAVAKFVGAPAGLKLISLIPIGYPIEPSATPPKRGLSEMLHWERFPSSEENTST